MENKEITVKELKETLNDTIGWNNYSLSNYFFLKTTKEIAFKIINDSSILAGYAKKPNEFPIENDNTIHIELSTVDKPQVSSGFKKVILDKNYSLNDKLCDGTPIFNLIESWPKLSPVVKGLVQIELQLPIEEFDKLRLTEEDVKFFYNSIKTQSNSKNNDGENEG